MAAAPGVVHALRGSTLVQAPEGRASGEPPDDLADAAERTDDFSSSRSSFRVMKNADEEQARGGSAALIVDEYADMATPTTDMVLAEQEQQMVVPTAADASSLAEVDVVGKV